MAAPPSYYDSAKYPDGAPLVGQPAYSAYPSVPTAVPVVQTQTQPLATQPAIVSTTTTTTAGVPPNDYQLQRAAHYLKLVFVFMAILATMGLAMLICGAIPVGKGVKTYDNYYTSSYSSSGVTKVRRDWAQGIWSGALHICMSVMFFILYAQAKQNQFNLEISNLRGWLYFFCVLLSLLAAVAFSAMVMGAITAAFLQDKDSYDFLGNRCRTTYITGEKVCTCDNYDYVEKATCNEAAGLYHGLYTAVAVMNGISVILIIIAAVFSCIGTCAGCCGASYYSAPGTVWATPTATSVIHTAPQMVVSQSTVPGGYAVAAY